MQIVINVAAYYDWEPAELEPLPEDIQALRAKPGNDGKWLSRVLVDAPSHTSVSLPESQIQSILEHFTRTGVTKTRAKVVAWLLEEKVMPHHSHPDHFTSIQVDGEPELEAFLNSYFETDAKQTGNS